MWIFHEILKCFQNEDGDESGDVIIHCSGCEKEID
jgi:hypothetical protein